jgi:hypothetical protein
MKKRFLYTDAVIDDARLHSVKRETIDPYQNKSATRLRRVADFRSAHMMEYGAYCAMI